MASNVFSMQGEAQPTLEGMQLGLEQSPVRKTPPLLIETTQISLSDHSLSFFKGKKEEFQNTVNVPSENDTLFSKREETAPFQGACRKCIFFHWVIFRVKSIKLATSWSKITIREKLPY